MHRIVRTWHASGSTPGAVSRLELCLTPCIVSHPPGECDALVNPANERLDGTQFDPSTASRAFGSTIVYPSQAIDGLVTEFGGDRLFRTLQALPQDTDGSRCPTGSALVTSAEGELTCAYSHLVHAVAPFYRAEICGGHGHEAWREQLRRCWKARRLKRPSTLFEEADLPARMLPAGSGRSYAPRAPPEHLRGS